ncbi:ATP-dependent dethiobiotin synthetase BioD 1 [Rubripirellula tenax]|uniref:ATP-dependent dethiobiotin synthetase BioD n=1 Tax=Rubripirellula tenax TaxID=2528015 RepID=A0A5C6EZZ3_9BACT|nr:dethiobiotin synthase [Rubripirellula tenax]TWU54602.1 ATP-dependent dethiobiotin synthetase BioD 1 [Rubripirellula tenax]
MTSPHPKPPTLFFAGTDTDVGKTFVACMFARLLRDRGHRVGIYKPVASGCRDENAIRIADDAVALWNAAGRPGSIQRVCPQMFLAPLAPPAAAAQEGRQVDAERLFTEASHWDDVCDALIIEGAGGLFSPLADGVLNIDLARKFADAHLIIVAANRLGVIHQTLATIEAARNRGRMPVGIVLCDPKGTAEPSTDTNASQIAAYTDVPIIGNVPYLTSTDALSDVEAFVSTKFIDELFMQ